MILQLFLALILTPLFDGICRILRAKIQSRQGPPIFQTYFDLFKLLKRDRTRAEGVCFVFIITPYVCIAISGLLVMLVGAKFGTKFNQISDLIVIIYLLVAFRFILNLAAFDSQNPFASVGANRENILALYAEPVMICAVIVICLMFGDTNLVQISNQINLAINGEFKLWKFSYILSGIVFLWAIYIEMTRKPFDIAEAEQETQEGVIAEFSGRDLAFMEIANLLKQYAVISLFLGFYFPFWFDGVLANSLLNAFLVGIFYVGAILIDNFGPRYSMFLSLKLNAFCMFSLGIMSLILFFVGV